MSGLGTSVVDAQTITYVVQQYVENGWKATQLGAGKVRFDKGNAQVDVTVARGELTAERRVILGRTRVSDELVSWATEPSWTA
jgi:hypothetical protein